jgi:hypothetical protein
MSAFTMPLKELLDQEGGILEADNAYDGRVIGLGDYPIFDEAYRDHLNRKIIEHFWNREIGQESASLFTFALQRKMNEIMPLMNQHYVLSQMKIDPLSTIDIKTVVSRTGNSETTGTTDSTSDSSSGSRTVNSDTPQNTLSENGDYATSMSDANSKGTATSNSTTDSTVKNTEDGNTEMSGYSGHQAALIFEMRRTLVNVDMMVIDRLEELFMGVWDNGDEYFARESYYFGGIW